MERLGTGIGWRPEIADAVERMPGVDWVEAVAENVCPGHLPDSLRRLRERGVIVVPHGVSLGLGGAERPDADRLAALAERAAVLGSPLVTEHIAFVRAGGFLTASPRLEAGHLLPVPRTRDALDVLCENVRIAQDALPVPLAVENIAALISWPAEEMTEGQFLYELADRTGVRLLIDVANLHTNHVNRGEDPAKALAELPLEAIAYVHVAGGFARDGVWHDSHAHPVPRPVLDILTDLASRVRPPGVLLERDENFPEPAELQSELTSIRRALEAGAVERVKAEVREAGRAAASAVAGTGAETPGPGVKAPRAGAGTPGPGEEASRTGVEAPGRGAGVVHARVGAVRAGVGAVRAGVGTAGPEVKAPRAGAGTPGPGARANHTEVQIPGPGTRAPHPGGETPGPETDITHAGVEAPGTGTAVPHARVEAPEAGVATPPRGDETGAAEATRGVFGRPHSGDAAAAGRRPEHTDGGTRQGLADADDEARLRLGPADGKAGQGPADADEAREGLGRVGGEARPRLGDAVPRARSASGLVGEEVRLRLALAQTALLSALVAGTPVPEGFDRVRIGVQARALAAKRADVVAKVAPELPLILGAEYRPAFLGYAQASPMTGGYRRDALDFAGHLLAAGRPGGAQARRELREWWLERSGPRPRSGRPVHRLARATRRVLLRR